jgi:DedD protein
MVGRGVDNSTGVAEAQAPKPALEERIVPEEPAKASPPAAEELTYAQRLESDKASDSLDKPAKSDAPAPSVKPADKPAGTEPPASQKAASPRPAPSAKPSPKTTPAPKASAKAPSAKPEPGSLTIQVGAFKDKDTAESVVARLKKKGYAAFVVAPSGADGLFNVRVGSYAARADAERVETKLRDEEKFKPFIVKN